jgi:anti-sigma regulatory factor (Ser/Thr protein kinase)
MPRSEGALWARLLVVCTAAEPPVDGLCACGTALSKECLSLPDRPSGLVGRVLESGHTAGEPIVAGQDPGTTVDKVLMGADDAQRVAGRMGSGDLLAVGDVAAGGRPRRRRGRSGSPLTQPPGPQPSVSMRIPGGTGAPLHARRSVLSRIVGQLTETAAADAALIISELVTNSVLHANVGPHQTLAVECATLSDRLRITVTDPGSRLEPHLRPSDHEADGGYGLAIVAALSLAWGVMRDTEGTTSVWCEVPLDTPLCGHRPISSTERSNSDGAAGTRPPAR